MKSDLLLDAVGEVRDAYIQDAHAVPLKNSNIAACEKREKIGRKGKTLWLKRGAATACLCVIVAGTAFALYRQTDSSFRQGDNPLQQGNVSSQGSGDAQSGKPGNNHVQQWNTDFSPEQYFTYSNTNSISNETSSTSSLADHALPYAESSFFSNQREQLEAEGILPKMDAYPQFVFQANYNADESLYSLELTWSKQNPEDISDYSTLSVTAGYSEVPSIQDCIVIEIDEHGNVLEPTVTVTEREGILITAREENRQKTLTYQTGEGWYQIAGSWNDSYEAVADLLDWFWVHPIDFGRFPSNKGDHYTSSHYTEMPDEETLQGLAAYLPSFEAFGFICQEMSITSKNGIPVSLEGHFISGITIEQLENMEYTVGENGCATIHWCVDAEPNAYELENGISSLEELREDQIRSLAPVDAVTTEIKVPFTQGDSMVTVYASDAGEAWKLIESLQTGQK